MKNLRVTVDGKVYNVTVEMLDAPAAPAPSVRAPVTAAAPATVPTAAVPAAAPKAAAGGAGEIGSPLAGKVVSIDVALGQAVDEGQQVATIEAMKMNTYVFAPKAGKVTAITAVAGTAVEEGAPLLVVS